MRYDRHNLIGLIRSDLHNYPCPRCNDGSFALNSLEYVVGGPVTVDVNCFICGNKQTIKFHINVI